MDGFFKLLKSNHEGNYYNQPGVLIEKADYFKDDEFEHGAGEGEVDAEDQLDEAVVELVVSEQHLDEEDPADQEEDHLAGEHDHCVPQQLHGGAAVI